MPSQTHAIVQNLPSETAAQSAATWLANHLASVLPRHQHVFLLFSGGSAIQMYVETLQILPKSVTFVHVTCSLVDERFGPFEHQDSNELQMKQVGIIDAIAKRGGHFLPWLNENMIDPLQLSERLNQQFQQAYQENDYKILLMGLGPDGHTAGWLPTQTRERFEKNYDPPRYINYYEVDPMDSTNQFHQRLTITLKAVREADEVIIYTTGIAKQASVNDFIDNQQPFYHLPSLGLYSAKNPPILLTDCAVPK